MRPVSREEARDMADAHAEGLHADLPRDFCPECEGRDLSTYPLVRDLEKAHDDKESA